MTCHMMFWVTSSFRRVRVFLLEEIYKYIYIYTPSLELTVPPLKMHGWRWHGPFGGHLLPNFSTFRTFESFRECVYIYMFLYDYMCMHCLISIYIYIYVQKTYISPDALRKCSKSLVATAWLVGFVFAFGPHFKRTHWIFLGKQIFHLSQYVKWNWTLHL